VVKLQRGTVVKKLILDENGKNPKPHPIVIISKQEDIDKHDEVLGVVASHTAAIRGDPDGIHLPHVPGGEGRYPFTKETVAVCRWIVRVKRSDVKPEEVEGFVQLKHLEPVLKKIREIRDKKKAEKSKPKTPPTF